MHVTREMLVEWFERDHYRRCDHSNYYCEVSVDDEFHREEMSGDEGNRDMFKLKEDQRHRMDELRREHDVNGGEYICEVCRDLLSDMISDERPRRLTQRTRKSLQLPSKPARVRRIPA